MKLLFTLFLSCMIADCGFTQSSIYNLSLAGANNKQYSMNSFKGKMLWIVILPSKKTKNDKVFLQRIDSVAKANSSMLQTLAIPSYEDDYLIDNDNLMDWYKNNLDSSIIISQPLYTHKTSGSKQDTLFQWLTKADQNMYFDKDVEGIGSSFFVDAQGNLFAVIGPEARFSNKILKKIFQR